MATLLKWVGGIWAVIGVGNLAGMPWTTAGEGLLTVGLMFNVLLFIIPGLIVYGIGAALAKKHETNVTLPDHDGGADYSYPREVVFKALVAVVPRVPGMKVHTVDELSGRILAKAGGSLMSWGENIPIMVSESAPGRTRVKITSAPKVGVLFGAFDLGKNRKNVELLLTALSASLTKTPPTADPVAAREAPMDPAERIAKLHELLNKGLVTAADVEKRKGEILSEI